jgi:hypothetical protein
MLRIGLALVLLKRKKAIAIPTDPEGTLTGRNERAFGMFAKI